MYRWNFIEQLDNILTDYSFVESNCEFLKAAHISTKKCSHNKRGYDIMYNKENRNFEVIKRGAKLQQARLMGASDDVNKRRGALAPAGVGGGFKSPTDGRMEPAAYRGGGHRRLL